MHWDQLRDVRGGARGKDPGRQATKNLTPLGVPAQVRRDFGILGPFVLAACTRHQT